MCACCSKYDFLYQTSHYRKMSSLTFVIEFRVIDPLSIQDEIRLTGGRVIRIDASSKNSIDFVDNNDLGHNESYVKKNTSKHFTSREENAYKTYMERTV